MSKLVERLERVDQAESTPMGFGAASGRDRTRASVVIIGCVESGRLTRNFDVPDADAILVRSETWKERSVNKVAKLFDGRLWGVRTRDISEDLAKQLKDNGCDFIVLDGEDSEAAVLNDTDLGKIVPLDPDLSEETARAVHDLPFDGALFSPGDDLLPLTVGKMISIQQIRGMVSKPFMMTIPAKMSAAELQVIRNAGITGLVLDTPSAEEIDRIREAAASFPRRRPVRDRDAMAPRLHGLAVQEQGIEEDDGDDEDF